MIKRPVHEYPIDRFKLLGLYMFALRDITVKVNRMTKFAPSLLGVLIGMAAFYATALAKACGPSPDAGCVGFIPFADTNQPC